MGQTRVVEEVAVGVNAVWLCQAYGRQQPEEGFPIVEGEVDITEDDLIHWLSSPSSTMARYRSRIPKAKTTTRQRHPTPPIVTHGHSWLYTVEVPLSTSNATSSELSSPVFEEGLKAAQLAVIIHRKPTNVVRLPALNKLVNVHRLAGFTLPLLGKQEVIPEVIVVVLMVGDPHAIQLQAHHHEGHDMRGEWGSSGDRSGMWLQQRGPYLCDPDMVFFWVTVDLVAFSTDSSKVV